MMRYRQTFTVEGTGRFPYDMLRYDHCWPANENQTPLLDSTEALHSENWFKTPRRVVLMREVEHKGDVPTAGRWRSFNWNVIEESVETHKV